MKDKIFIILTGLILGAMLCSCQEEPVGQTATNHTPPGKITNAHADPLPGGARITYTLPKDNDLLYVKAVYNVNGVVKTEASSLYNKSLEIKGFGTTDEQTVLLYCVNRSNVYSEPVEVKIRPDTPPITHIRNSMKMNPGFGGVQILWKNEYKAPVAIYVVAADSIGDIKVADVVYTSAEDGRFNLRGFDDSSRLFGVYVRDHWDNYSDTLKGVFTPYFEEELEKAKFKRASLLADNTTIYGSGWAFERLWDGDINSPYIQGAAGSHPNYFTIDLGVEAKLSRYSLWHRLYNPSNSAESYMYGVTPNLKKWKIYGASQLSTSTDLDYWKDDGWKADWFLLADCYSIKPSGEGSTITQEDYEYAMNGFEFEIPLNAPSVRFIRFYVETTWSGTGTQVNIGEVAFWGEVKNKN